MVKCRSCSADIDAKAIVCYRCGAPTAGAPAAAGVSGRRWPGLVWLLAGALAALAGGAYFAWYR
jgi:hypothetical protein